VFAKFVGQYLGPAIESAGLSTKIMLGTMSNNVAGTDPAVVSAVMGDSTARSYVDLIGMQWGMQSGVSGARQYNLPIWQTEHKCGNYPWMSGYVSSAAPNDQAYGVETWGLIRDWIRDGATSYSSWNMVLDRVGKGNDQTRDWAQNALLVVDGGNLILTPAYHVFRHSAQYVSPGARVVGTSGGDAIAFKNPDGSQVAVMYNSGGATQYTVQIAGRLLQFSMPGNGWATVVSP
jgi:glucosylceramidase